MRSFNNEPPTVHWRQAAPGVEPLRDDFVSALRHARGLGEFESYERGACLTEEICSVALELIGVEMALPVMQDHFNSSRSGLKNGRHFQLASDGVIGRLFHDHLTQVDAAFVLKESHSSCQVR